jgi:two-component system LytT family response regulator
MQKEFTAIIVDDERPARLMVLSLLEKYKMSVHIVGEAANGKKAIELIEDKQPDLIFLDIQMPDMNGFEMLSKLTRQPLVIFTTAYEQYALDAFKENSIDYLIKPIDEDRFDQSIQKLQRLGATNRDMDIKHMMSIFNQLQPKKEITALPVKTGQKILLVRFSEIVYCQSGDGYVSLFTDSGKEYVSDLNLVNLVQKLPENFLRVQKSTIINKDKIKEIQRYFNNRLIITLNDQNNTKITTGTNYINLIREALGLK